MVEGLPESVWQETPMSDRYRLPNRQHERQQYPQNRRETSGDRLVDVATLAIGVGLVGGMLGMFRR